MVDGRERAQTEKENSKQRQMGLLGNDFAAREGRRQVPQQSSLQPCQQQLSGHPFLRVPHRMSFLLPESESSKSYSFSHLSSCFPKLVRKGRESMFLLLQRDLPLQLFLLCNRGDCTILPAKQHSCLC